MLGRGLVSKRIPVKTRDGKMTSLVTMGGDKPPADLLVTKPKGYWLHREEFQPYCEGWGWVKPELAVLGPSSRPQCSEQRRKPTAHARQPW